MTFTNNALRLYNINLQENQPVGVLDMGDSVKKLVANFDNTGLVMVIGAYYEMENKQMNNKLELHSVSLDGSKGKFESIFLGEAHPIY